MSYILNKTNGTIVTTVQDASIDSTADLTFVGRNYAGYGEIQNENFVKLLENFANTTAPTKPIEGEIWYDTANKHLNFYDAIEWKSIATLEVQTTSPLDVATPAIGDLWYNKTEQQLNVFNGEKYILIGPPVGADTKAGWRGDFETATTNPNIKIYNIKAVINDNIVATVSDQEYSLGDSSNSTYPIYEFGAKLHKGINLTGADPDTGNSEAAGAYFWGSAMHSLYSNTATYAAGATFTVGSENAYQPVAYVTTSSTTRGNFNIDYGFTYNASTNYVKATRFEGVATSALYADLAERYAADDVYQPGTVLVIGGDKEVTITEERANTAVAGIVSKNPAYMMNSEAGNDETHPYIALKGRVPCQVVGTILKGDLLVTSTRCGHAEAFKEGDSPNAVIAKALEDNFEGFAVIEVMVV